MVSFYPNIVDGWLFSIPSTFTNDTNWKDVQYNDIEDESLKIIAQTLEIFDDFFQITSIGIGPDIIYPSGISSKDYIFGKYKETPLTINTILHILSSQIQRRCRANSPRLTSIGFHGMIHSFLINEKSDIIRKWIGRTSNGMIDQDGFPQEIFNMNYALAYRHAPVTHDFFIYVYSEDWFEVGPNGQKKGNELEIARLNRNELFIHLQKFISKYPGISIKKIQPEQVWTGIDYLSLPFGKEKND